MSRFPIARMTMALVLTVTPVAVAIAADLNERWRCIRTDARGYIHECEMRLTVDAEQRIEGRIEWTLLRSPETEHRAKLGATAVEYIRGRVTSSESLFFEGHGKDDPQEVIALDIYPLQLSPGGKWMFGRTETAGSWTGQFYATPLDGSPRDP